jgi:pectate lyase
MNMSTKIALLLLLLIQGRECGLWDIEGFGADMDIHYDEEFMVKTEADLLAYCKRNNSLIRFAPALTLTLTRIVTVANQSSIILLGPVTLGQFGIYIYNSSNIVVRDVRILNASIYGILIYHSHGVVVDHCSILDASRTDIDRGKCIDITEASSNVTISRCLLGYTFPVEQLSKFKGLLIANFHEGPVTNVSLHHNLFYCDYQRSPEISTPGLFDMRQNVVFNYTEYGSRIRNGAFGNFIDNLYLGGKKDPLVFEQDVGGIHAAGNSWLYNCRESRKIEDLETHAPFTAPAITSATAKETVSQAGCLDKSRWETLVYREVSKYLQ